MNEDKLTKEQAQYLLSTIDSMYLEQMIDLVAEQKMVKGFLRGDMKSLMADYPVSIETLDQVALALDVPATFCLVIAKSLHTKVMHDILTPTLDVIPRLSYVDNGYGL